MKVVVINRATWAIPRQTKAPRLLNHEEGTRCCLGFYAKACGVRDEALENSDLFDDGMFAMPSDLESLGKMSRRLLQNADAIRPRGSGPPLQWEGVLQQINDAENVTDAEREAWVREVFRRILKRRVRFVGKYAVPEPK
jgi:hypothetical protein